MCEVGCVTESSALAGLFVLLEKKKEPLERLFIKTSLCLVSTRQSREPDTKLGSPIFAELLWSRNE